VRDAIIDGEATVLGSTPVADFQALGRELCKHHGSRLTFSAFDLLYLDGRDLRDRPLIERKEALRRILKGAPKTLVYVDHFEAEGESVFEHACRMKLEASSPSGAIRGSPPSSASPGIRTPVCRSPKAAPTG
jgi:bifunctional non-homologous end joining protein LigD